MGRFVEESDRGQWTLLPECLDDFIDESNPVRVTDLTQRVRPLVRNIADTCKVLGVIGAAAHASVRSAEHTMERAVLNCDFARRRNRPSV